MTKLLNLCLLLSLDQEKDRRINNLKKKLIEKCSMDPETLEVIFDLKVISEP